MLQVYVDSPNWMNDKHVINQCFNEEVFFLLFKLYDTVS